MPTPLRAPTQVTIALTGRCNLACKYCYYADEMVSLSDLPTAVWLKFFEEMRDFGVMQVVLSGGEPFSRQDIWELMDGVVRNKMRFSLLTNATMITEKVAERLVEYRRRLDYIQVSIDGSSAETHDRIRGKGSFKRVMRGIEAMQKHNLPWTARVTINRMNVHDLQAILDMLYHRLNLKQFGVNEAFPRGAGQCNNTLLEMTPEERRLSFAVMKAFDQAHPGVATGAQAGPLVMAEFLEKVAHAERTGDYQQTHPTGFLTGCNIMWEKLSVLHDGTYVPCHQLPHITLGKVGVDSLKDVWLNSPGLLQLRQRHTIALESLPHCKGCEYQPYCTGGCPGVAYAIMGEVNTINPRDCYRAYVGKDDTHAY